MSKARRPCPICGDMVKKADMRWSYRLGIPFQLVCINCWEIIRGESEGIEFDPCYAGERMEDDY